MAEDVHLDFKPWPHQRAAHAMRRIIRFLVLVWHRRAGKTLFCINELGLAALQCTKPNGRYGYVCPTLTQAKKVSWQYLRAFARKVPGAIIREGELSVTFPNNARVQLFGADNPDSFRGQYFDGLVLDEVAQMKAQVWGEVLRPALMDRQGWAIFIGTPNGVNLFHELYQRGVRNEEGWGSDLKRWSDTKVLPDAEIEQARREMTEAEWAQEMECDFSAAATDTLIKLDTVLAAQARRLEAAAYVYAAKVVGVDVARYGNDKTAITLRQGLIAHPALEVKKLDTMAVASQVCLVLERETPDACFIDVGGIGAGVFDRVLQLGFEVVPVNFAETAMEERFENRRAEMWWLMADWLKLASIPDDSELSTDLTGPRYTFKNRRGRIQLESKEEMRKRGIKSPDKGDSLACTFYAPVVPKGMRRHSRTVATEYDWRTGKAR